MASAPAPPSRRLLPLLPKSAFAEPLPKPLQIGAALQDQIFHVRCQPVVDGGEDRVVALAGVLDHRIAGYCRRNRCRCRRRRSWCRRRRRRRGGCCRYCRRSCWPGRCRSPAGRRRPAAPSLHIGGQPVIDGGEDSIVTLAGVLDHRIAGVVDDIGIVAGTAVMASAPAPPSRILLPVLPKIELPGRCRSPAGRRRPGAPESRRWLSARS